VFIDEEMWGNVREKGIVNITSSGDGRNKCWQLANHGWTSYGGSTNNANSWACFDFKNSAVCVMSYTLKSISGDAVVLSIGWHKDRTIKALGLLLTRIALNTSLFSSYGP
jgi:hypothetical protein